MLQKSGISMRPFLYSSAGVDMHCRHISEKKLDLQHQYSELGRQVETTRAQFMQLKKNIDQLNVSGSSVLQNNLSSRLLAGEGETGPERTTIC